MKKQNKYLTINIRRYLENHEELNESELKKILCDFSCD